MKNVLKPSDFDFEYTGGGFSEKELINIGYKQLTGKELLSKISNKTIFGDYLWNYKFITDIYNNGKVEGINNAGSHDFGKWSIDFEKNTFQLVWKNNWLDTTTRAYEVNGNIEFYDINTKNWITTFKKFIAWEKE